jgi:hypothetical protein
MAHHKKWTRIDARLTDHPKPSVWINEIFRHKNKTKYSSLTNIYLRAHFSPLWGARLRFSKVRSFGADSFKTITSLNSVPQF